MDKYPFNLLLGKLCSAEKMCFQVAALLAVYLSELDTDSEVFFIRSRHKFFTAPSHLFN